MNYDCTADTEKHISRVRDLIEKCIVELDDRAELHDWDKLGDPVEKRLFDEYTPKLKNCTYGSLEYQEFLKGLKPALDRHYKNNRHHPEHFENGIKEMNLIDILEMICDWKASTERHEDGDIYKSIELNQKRFNYSDDIKNLLINTAKFFQDTESV